MLGGGRGGGGGGCVGMMVTFLTSFFFTTVSHFSGTPELRWTMARKAHHDTLSRTVL